MDRDVERELERINKVLSKIDDTQDQLELKVSNLGRDILRFWYTGIGIAVGFLVKELGVEKLLGHLL